MLFRPFLGGSRLILPSGRRCVHIIHTPLLNVAPRDKFKIIFFGREEFSCLTLKELYEAKDVWKELHVATFKDRMISVGRGKHELSSSPLKKLAEELGLPIHYIPDKQVDFKDFNMPNTIEPVHDNSMIISSSFGYYIPKKLLKLVIPSRKLNVHPSMLPLLRGPAPIQRAIADGMERTGVTIMEMEPVSYGYDVGDIWAKKEVPVPTDVTYHSLEKTLGAEGGKLLVQVLRGMISGEIKVATPQDHELATKAPAIRTGTPVVQWSNWDAHKIVRMDRAFGHQRSLVTKTPWGSNFQLLEMNIATPGSSTETPPPAVDTSSSSEAQSAQTEASSGVSSSLDFSTSSEPAPSRIVPPIGSARFDPASSTLHIQCINNTILSVNLVKHEGKKALRAKEWWNGVPRKWKKGGTYSDGRDGWVRFGSWKERAEGEDWVEVVLPDGIEDGDSKVALTAGVTAKRVPDNGIIGMLS